METAYLRSLESFLSNQPFRHHSPEALAYIGGIVGGETPSRYSQSPVLWNHFFRLLEVPAYFAPLDLPDPAKLLTFIRYILLPPLCLDLTVTSPYKGTAYHALRELSASPNFPVALHFSERVHHLQSLNHCVLQSDRASYFVDSTDGEGMVRALQKRRPLAGARLLLVGAGGAAASIGYEAVRAGAEVWIANIIEEDAFALARRLQRCFTDTAEAGGPSAPVGIVNIRAGGWERIPAWAGESDCIVSAITESSPLTPEELEAVPPSTLLADTRYDNRALFAQAARRIGRSCVDGREMLFGQFYGAAKRAGETLGFPPERVESALNRVEHEFLDPTPRCPP